MIRITTLTVFTAAALLAGGNAARAAQAPQAARAAQAPQAAGIVVHVAGRDPAAVRADIVAAARKVCADALLDALPLEQQYSSCIRDTVDYSMQQIAGLPTDYDLAAK